MCPSQFAPSTLAWCIATAHSASTVVLTFSSAITLHWPSRFTAATHTRTSTRTLCPKNGSEVYGDVLDTGQGEQEGQISQQEDMITKHRSAVLFYSDSTDISTISPRPSTHQKPKHPRPAQEPRPLPAHAETLLQRRDLIRNMHGRSVPSMLRLCFTKSSPLHGWPKNFCSQFS